MNTKTFILMLLAIGMALTATGCASQETVPALSGNELKTVFSQRMTRPELPDSNKPEEPIYTGYADRGLLRICYKGDPGEKYKLQVLKGEQWVAYNLKADGSNEDFSLQYGNGEYTARIMRNVEADQYIAVETKTFSVSIADETQVFLNSIQNVNWDYTMQPIEDVPALIAAALEYASDESLDYEATNELYTFVCSHVSYDYDKIYDLDYDYLPDIEQTYAEGTGICYDYASLLAAMLRSVSIPTKLVKGYAAYNPDEYHAWNEVYLDGKWYVIDSTYDSTTGVYKPIFKDAENYAKTYEY